MLTSFGGLLKSVNHKRKVKLFQLAMLLIAVVALASTGIAKIQHSEDFESYDDGDDISKEECWPDGSGAFVKTGLSLPKLNGNAGNKALTGGGATHFFDFNPCLGLALTDESVFALYVYEPSYTRYWLFQPGGNPTIYSIKVDPTAEAFQWRIDDGPGPVGPEAIDLPNKPETWYRIIFAGNPETKSLDIYLRDLTTNEEICAPTPAPTLKGTYERFFFDGRNENHEKIRVDNIIFADSKKDIDNLPPPIGAAVESAGKLTTTWAHIKAE